MGYTSAAYDFSVVDHISSWAGYFVNQGYGLDPNWHGEMLSTCQKLSKTPVFYGNFIGSMAKQMWGLQECDAGSPNLCQNGADFIRQYRNAIVSAYANFASQTFNWVGSNMQVVWLIEPDFWQYYGISAQSNGALSGPYMRALFDDIVRVIRVYLPNSLVSWNMNPSLSQADMQQWWAYFRNGATIDFIYSSGGVSVASAEYIASQGPLTYAFMNKLTGKRILVDTGYGVTSSGHNSDWDTVSNLIARISDGVFGVTQANAKSNWTLKLSNIRPKLPNTC
jgi:hypothetical protein